MTGWDILDKFIGSFPPIVMALILLAVLTAVVIFIIGFSKHGVNFLKYGFQQKNISDLGEKIDGLDTRLTDKINDLGNEFHTELEAIKVNHFGHLKNFLTELTSILLDKDIINNTDKARLAPQPSPQGEGSPLDNQLRDM